MTARHPEALVPAREPRAAPGHRGHLLVLNERDPMHPRAGGAEVHVLEIGRRLVERGYAVTHAACAVRGRPAREMLEGVEILRLGPLPLYYPRAAWLCWHGTRRGRFDVVVEHLNKLPFFSPLLARGPVTAVCHHLFGATAFQQVSWPVAAVVWGAEKLIPSFYGRAAWVAVSESTRLDLAERGLPGEAIAIVHNGIAQDPTSAVAPPSRRPTRIAYLGRLEPYKRVDLLLRVVATLAPRFPELEAVIIGRGTDQPRLERLARELGIAERTRFVGFVPDAERDALLARRASASAPRSKKAGGSPCSRRTPSASRWWRPMPRVFGMRYARARRASSWPRTTRPGSRSEPRCC